MVVRTVWSISAVGWYYRKATSGPDLALSDFRWFLTVKDWLKRMYTVDGDNLFEQLLEMLHASAVDEFERVFTAWIDRVRQVGEGNGDYIG
jgi:hypothetical protein